MADLRVTEWRRYGHARLYVSDGERRVGWYDLKTGEAVIEVAGEDEGFWSAVRLECERLRARGGLDGGTVVPAPAAGQRPQGVGSPVEADLARTRPGAAARARAAELRGRRPVRTGLARLLGVRTEAADFAFGAGGERIVGRKLDRWARRGGWHVLHAVPVGRGVADIDHVLIGAFGVVTINTKRTRGAVWAASDAMMVNGIRVDYLRNSRHERQRAGRLLTSAAKGGHVPVATAIVFVGARKFTLKSGGPSDIAVLRDTRALRRWLRRRGRVLEPDQVTKLYELARRPSTWQR